MNKVKSPVVKRTRADAVPKDVGRFSTTPGVREIVWIRAAGHCELCGTDLTRDFRVGTTNKLGEVAHILPASPQGPRADSAHNAARAKALTNDLENLLLACRICHGKIDCDAEGYPKDDLSGLHNAHRQRIELAAKAPDAGKALALIFLSQHFETVNDIRNRDLLVAMSSEGLSAIDQPIREVLPAPGPTGRDSHYWRSVTDRIQHALQVNLRRASSFHGDIPVLAVAGLADIPALMTLGQAIGDRTARCLFSPARGNGLRWPDPLAKPPTFLFRSLTMTGDRQALVLSISATVPLRDVEKALPGARIDEITIDNPNYAMVRNRSVIDAFRDALQMHLSVLEARSPGAIHVFAAIPSALAIEFGAVLTTQHRHPYVIYDRNDSNDFVPSLPLGRATREIPT